LKGKKGRKGKGKMSVRSIVSLGVIAIVAFYTKPPISSFRRFLESSERKFLLLFLSLSLSLSFSPCFLLPLFSLPLQPVSLDLEMIG